MVLSHELTHALEDQRFGLERSARGRATTPRSPAWRSSRARATLVMQEYLVRYIGAEKALGGLLGVRLPDRPGPAAVPPGPADLALPRRRAVHPVAAPHGRRYVEARRSRGPRARARQHRAGHAPGEVGGGGEAAARCASRPGSTTTGGGPPPARGASGRRASCSAATTRPPPAGAGTATSSGSARELRVAAAAATATCWYALALGQRARRARVRGRAAGRRCRRGAHGDTAVQPAATPSRSCSRPPRRSPVEC